MTASPLDRPGVSTRRLAGLRQANDADLKRRRTVSARRPSRPQLRDERAAFARYRINVELIRESLYRSQPGTRAAVGGIAVAQTFANVGHAGALVQSQHFTSRDAVALESARQQLPLRGVLDQIGRGFRHHKRDSANVILSKTNGPRHAGHFPPGLRHRAHFPNLKVYLVAHPQPLISIA